MTPPAPIKIHIPSDTKPQFSNTAHVTVLNDSVVLQFAFVRPNTAQGVLLSEIIMSPKQAIDFNRALEKTIKKHFTRHLDTLSSD